MLALDRPLGTLGRLSLWADHEDPGQVWYLPVQPRLARAIDGGPEIGLIRYERPVEGLAEGEPTTWGSLSLVSELVVEEEDLEAAREALEEEGQAEVRLSPVPIVGGKAVLVTTLARTGESTGGPPMAELLLGETTPDLMGRNRALFGMVLPDEEVVGMVEGLLREPGPVPIGIRYELEYEGIRPAIHARITAHYDNIYESLGGGFQVGGSYQEFSLGLDISKKVQEMRERGDIVVEITELTTDEDLRRSTEKALEWIQGRILSDFFKPSLTPSNQDPKAALLEAIQAAAASIGVAVLDDILDDPELAAQVGRMVGVDPSTIQSTLSGEGGSIPGADQLPFSLKLRFQFEQVERHELKTLSHDLSITAAEHRIAAPQGLLSDLGLGGGLEGRIRRVSAAEVDAVVDVDVLPAVDPASLGLSHLLVHLRYPPAGEAATTKSILFQPGEPVAGRFAFRPVEGVGRRYAFQAEMHFSSEARFAMASPVFSGPWTESMARTLVLSPLSFLRLEEIRVMPGDLDLDLAPQVRVELRAGEAGPSTSLVLSAEAKEQRWAVRLDGDARLEARFTWYLSGGGEVAGAWRPVEGTVVLVPNPWRSFREVRLLPLLPADILDATVTLRLDDGPHQPQVEEVFAPGERRGRKVRLPSISEEPPPAIVEVLVFRGDGTVYNPDPLVLAEPVFVVGDRPGRPRRLGITLLGPPRLAEAGLSALRVELLDKAGQVTDGFLFTEGRRGPATLGTGEEGEITYEVSRYGLDGRPLHPPERRSTTTDIVLPAIQAPGGAG